MKKPLIFFLITVFFFACEKNNLNVVNQEDNVITTSGNAFVPSTIVCNIGDTIYFELGSSHNAVEVSESEYNNNAGTPLANGFNIDFGESAYIVASELKTYYYVCQPHLPQMKGIIIVE